MPTGADLDQALLATSYFQDPYPVHQRLRGDDPVHWSRPWQTWLVSRHADVRAALLRDGIEFSAVGQTDAALAHLSSAEHHELESLARIFSAGLLWSDPPDHTRIRAAVNKALTPRDAERVRPLLERTLADIIATMPRGAAFDAVPTIAEPIPVTMLAGLLGIPDAHIARFRAWAATLAEFIGSARPSADLARAAQAVVLEAGDFIAWLRERRRDDPSDDVISRLVAGERQGRELSRDEFTATIIVLLVGGHRTTTALIASSILHLGRDRVQQEYLRAQPDLMPRAVEELLRYESPHQRTIRIARSDTRIGDQAIKAGQVVALLNGSANRDPDEFPDADALRLDRSPNRHLALSMGAHFCIGAPLARLEASATLAALLAATRRLTVLEHQPAWLANYTLRTLTSLSIAIA